MSAKQEKYATNSNVKRCFLKLIIIIIIWTLQHSVACDDIKIVVKVAERNADRQHQNRVVKLRKIYM